jgi:hypothetical protein
MNKSDLEQLKKTIQNNYEADMAAINQLLRIYGEDRQKTANRLAASVEALRPKKSTSQIAEEIIKSSTDEFEIGTIYLKLRQAKGKEPSIHAPRIISQVINKLRQRNPPEIEVVKEGKGSRSGTYKLRTNYMNDEVKIDTTDMLVFCDSVAKKYGYELKYTTLPSEAGVCRLIPRNYGNCKITIPDTFTSLGGPEN